MSKIILIIGGTGLIGQTIYKILSERNPNVKTLIGTRKSNLNPNEIQIDVNNLETFKSLNIHNLDLIVVCTKDTNNSILHYAIQHKIDYIDITNPSSELIKAHSGIKNAIIDSKIVFSSGWMGGITPLLIYSTGISATEIKDLKIIVYYSTKDKAGDCSADFMAENVSKPFFTYQNNLAIKIKHFLNAEKNVFEFDNQARKVFDFDIPDLYIFNHIEKIPTVNAKLTFDSKLITSALAIMQKVNFFKILNFKEKKLIFGGGGKGDISTFEIVYTNNASLKRKITLMCEKGQSELTAFSTVLHVEKMLENSNPSGIYFSYQLHEPKQFIGLLTSNKSIKMY